VRNAVRLAHEKGFTSIAFPLIGAGSGGFNQEQAKALMLAELHELDVPIPCKRTPAPWALVPARREIGV
jgi:O-acetyl-ADP-ribose deacetylase (regulator of RNase III)